MLKRLCSFRGHFSINFHNWFLHLLSKAHIPGWDGFDFSVSSLFKFRTKERSSLCLQEVGEQLYLQEHSCLFFLYCFSSAVCITSSSVFFFGRWLFSHFLARVLFLMLLHELAPCKNRCKGGGGGGEERGEYDLPISILCWMNRF